ncbi:TraX protein [Mobilisporobacter senegalensis]|uniref:TraX protein n=1 Tax=Mobilisporobacter senegalensis TaxID=1329262 RepID=A0A3N1XPI8_9FIRM|nr:TraX family protein [Mobilisporobacter senegalensis]ROR28178.1 TraX protein [Mobilisporobacter senegalensis]
MNSFTLKMIAIITMLIDHTAHVLIPPDEPIYYVMRAIGRLAFPIFCFLIVEGLFHTRNVNKYMLRLGIFALISEIPFDLAIKGEPFYEYYQSVYFTLLIGLAVIYGLHKIKIHFPSNLPVSIILQLIVILAGCILAILLKTDYNAMGVILILAFYLFREKKLFLILSVLFVTIVIGGRFEGIASFSLIFILLYNGLRGPKVKYLFYAFYPVHLLCLYLIATFL